MNNRVRYPGVVLYLIALAGFTILIAGTVVAAEPSSTGLISQVPLREGLMVVGVDGSDRGDYEMIKTVTSVDAKAITVTILSEEPTVCGGEVFGRHGKRPSVSRRAVLREDLERARTIRFSFTTCVSEAEFNPGVTALGVSASVLRELKAKGETNLSIMGRSETVSGVLTRIEPQAVPFKVILNDESVEVAAIHTRWRSGKYDIEYWILDDPDNPLMLRKVSNGKAGLDVVKLSFPTGDTTARIERDLSKQGRTVVYGIYFDFASDRIKEESGPMLKEIAEVMIKNPTWRLAVEGHTDSIGDDEANLALSQRRAAAVRKALGDHHRIAPTRLEPAGFGETRPKATNETAEGRALNRRVELVRMDR